MRVEERSDGEMVRKEKNGKNETQKNEKKAKKLWADERTESK